MEISIDISNFIARQGDQKVGGKITPVLEKEAQIRSKYLDQKLNLKVHNIYIKPHLTKP
jgi:hypothetical protein